MIDNKKIEERSLTQQVKKEVGVRVFFITVLLLIAIVIATVFDVSAQLRDKEFRIDQICQNLESFIVSQYLIGNWKASQFRVESLNAESSFNIKWVENGEINGKKFFFHVLNWRYQYPIRQINASLGYFEITGSILDDKELIYDFFKRLFLLLIFVAAILFLLRPLLNKIPQKLFIEPIEKLLNLLENSDFHLKHPRSNPNQSKEICEIEKNIMLILKSKQEAIKNAALVDLSAQVAHDIRSPLAALDMVIKEISNVPEEQRVLIRNAANRIRDIANNLLVKQRNDELAHFESKRIMPELLIDILLGLVSEKRAEYKNNAVKFIVDIDESSYGIFVDLSALEFKRILSNLINNSVDSYENGKREVHINLSAKDKMVSIVIKDNGQGMSEEMVKKIMSGEMVSGKKNGNGLGLPYAIKTIKEWDGKFNIQSMLEKGTSIEMIFRCSMSPPWFKSSVNILMSQTVVIMDDDESIHQVWRKRFNTAGYKNKLIHFYQTKDLENWLKNNRNKNTIFLIDYELIGSDISGLEFIEKENLIPAATLVTSRYEESLIKEKCERLGVQIIPKSYSAHIPIKIYEESEVKKYDAILIDDDPMVHSMWNFSASLSNKDILTFFTENEFLSHIEFLDLLIPIYIDYHLRSDITGDQVAKNIYLRGFREIYLATGVERNKIEIGQWIKDVVGKEPPWNNDGIINV